MTLHYVAPKLRTRSILKIPNTIFLINFHSLSRIQSKFLFPNLLVTFLVRTNNYRFSFINDYQREKLNSVDRRK